MLDKFSDDRKLHYADQPSSSHWVKNNFVIGDVLGSGTFGTVYSVECRRRPGTIYAMKELTRNSLPRYVATELRILQRCGGEHNVMRMHAAHRDKDRVFIIMDYFEHSSLKNYIDSITTKEINEYMKNLLLALQYLHAKGIIHRDIKPSNFLYDRDKNRFSLIDFGLCQETFPSSSRKRHSRRSSGMQRIVSKRICLDANVKINDEDGENEESCMNEIIRRPDKRRIDNINKCGCCGSPRVCSICQARPRLNVNKAGTPGFRAPEILLRSSEQTPLIDVWAAGITFLSLLSRHHPIMRPADDHEAIAQMSALFGTAALRELATKLDSSLIISLVFPGLDIVKFVRAVKEDITVNAANPYCVICRNLFFGNTSGACLCKPSEEDSLRELAPEERQVFEVLRRCLIVDPDKRYTAEMLSTFFC